MTNNNDETVKTVFFGTPSFVIPVAEKTKGIPNIELAAVVTAPDKPVGRKGIPTPSPVKVWAKKNQIQVLTPEKINSSFKAAVKRGKFELGILAAYGKIIPQDLIDLFSKGIFILHPSLLPKYRGASPVQAVIIAGEKKAGISIIKMDAKMDHGPIICQQEGLLSPTDTSEDLYQYFFNTGAKLLAKNLTKYLKGEIKPEKQTHKEATYTKVLTRQDGYIDLKKPPTPKVFQRLIRAYYPWPGVWTKWQTQGKKELIIKFLPQGKIQPEGKNPMSPKDFFNGYPEAKKWLAKLAL